MTDIKHNKIVQGINVYDLPTLELKAYWAIYKLSSKEKDRFTSTEIARHLVDIGLSTSRQAIEYALAKNKKACHKSRIGYKLMQEGINLLEQSILAPGMRVIEANQPFTAKSFTLKKILGSKYSHIDICDPYLDVNTLDVVFKAFKKKTPIRILTSKIADVPAGTFKRVLGDLIHEGFLVEVRVYTSSIIHDRYIITDDSLFFSGNSLNYLGKKESFLIRLGADFRQSILATFNSRWKSSTAV